MLTGKSLVSENSIWTVQFTVAAVQFTVAAKLLVREFGIEITSDEAVNTTLHFKDPFPDLCLLVLFYISKNND